MNNPTEIEKNLTPEEWMGSSKGDAAWDDLIKAYRSLKDAKPGDRGEKDRRYAVAITKMEDVLSWFNSMIGHDGFG